MKIATWNVNSIRSRLDHVHSWLHNQRVDVLCLQETKVVDKDFPRSHFEQLGYHLYISGQKTYNGVAILSLKPLENVTTGFTPILANSAIDPSLLTELDEQKRVITGIIDGIRIVNLYVPNGSAVGSEKYQYKLKWLKVLRQYLQTLMMSQELVAEEQTQAEKIINPKSICVCGDFNIAPEDKDIHNPVAAANQIMASEPERQALNSILELGLADAFRKFNQEEGQFTWWDYRAAAFWRNWGWRIDHHYLTPDLYEKATSCIIDVTPRKLEKPSDHTPVIVEV